VLPPPEIDYRAELPPHQQIVEWIRASIEAGELRPGQVIPSEKDMTQQLGVARTTARRAVHKLREEGLVRTVPGRGTYVTRR
jgi:DNA-binding GntR family transcriptional regulator